MHGVLDVVLGSCADAAGRSGIPLNYERRTVSRHVALEGETSLLAHA